MYQIWRLICPIRLRTFFDTENTSMKWQPIALSCKQTLLITTGPTCVTVPSFENTCIICFSLSDDRCPFFPTGTDGKLNRVDAQSPVQTQTSQQQTQAAAHQQTFINPTIPPGYGYYYPTQGMPLGGFSYTPTMFPVS